MSMIKCARCECFIDAKGAAGIEGIYGDDSPWEYLCPGCCYNIHADARMSGDVEDQDQRIIRAFRHPLPAEAQGQFDTLEEWWDDLKRNGSLTWDN